MFEPLLTHQSVFYNDLKRLIAEQNTICVIGKSGIGKSFLSNKLCEEYLLDGYVTLLFTGDKLNQYRPYYPFHQVFNNESALNNYKELPIELSKEIPHIGNVVSIILERLLNKDNRALQQKYPYLNNEENSIISKLKYLMKNKETFLVFDNFQWWDVQSITLLSTIISSYEDLNWNYNCKKVFVFTSSTTNSDLLNFFEEHNIPQVKFKEMSYSQFLKDRHKLGFHNCLDEKQMQFIYKLADGNIFLFKQIANELPGNTLFPLQGNINGIQYLNRLLEKRMTELGATGKQIMYVLEFGSVIGLSFSYYELEQVTQMKKGQFSQIINCAKEWNLVENDQEKMYYKFVHDIILEIFKHRAEKNVFEYYEKLEECLMRIKPGSYLRRARYRVYMRDLPEAVLRYVMELLQELRDNNSVYTEIENEALGVMDDDIRSYYFSMKEAYQLYLQKKYQETLNILEKVPFHLNRLLLAERDLLKSRCLSKSLKEYDRKEAIRILEKYYDNDLIKTERDLWERLMTSLITAYYHGSYRDQAQELEEELLSNLSTRSLFDSTANLRIHILLRNSNSIHDSEFAEGFINKSVEYFSRKTSYGIPINILEYYKALLNYSATLCKNGKFQGAFQQTQTAIQLENNFPDIVFPRRQIIYNNYIVSGYLSGQVQLSESIHILGVIKDNLPPIAERLFYTSNLSIFYILNNELTMAESCLEQEMDYFMIDTDLEGSYKYRIYLLLTIIEYLKGNDIKAKTHLYIARNSIHTLTDHSYLKKKMDLFYDIIDHEERIVIPKCLDCCLLEKVPNYQNSVWNFLGLVFPYSILSNWDI